MLDIVENDNSLEQQFVTTQQTFYMVRFSFQFKEFTYVSFLRCY